MPIKIKDAEGNDIELPTAEEQQEAINKAVLGIVKDQTKSLAKTITESVTKSVGDALGATLDEKVGSIVDERVKAAAPAPDDAAAKKPDPELAALRKKLEDQEKLITTEREARVAAETKSRNDNAFSQLRSALNDKVRPDMLEHAAKLLFHVDKRVTFDEAGTPLFKDSDGTEYPLADGVARWAKSEEANVWRPAPGAKPDLKKPFASPGTKDPSKQQPYSGPAMTDEEKVRRAMEQETALAEKFPGLT